MLNVVSPSGYAQAFHEAVMLMTRHRALTLEMARREIVEPYAGQLLGAFWSVGHPLFLMGLYTFIFGVVFQLKIGGTRELPLDYTVYVLAGLIPWMTFQQSMAKSCSMVTGNASLVKTVIFHIEVLPIKTVLAAFVIQGVALAFLIPYVLITHGSLFVTYLLIPVLILAQFLAMCGVGFLFAAVAVFFRDLKDFVQLFSVAGLYIMPAVYLPENVPGLFALALYLNPFSYMIWCYQDVLYFGRFAHWWAWPVFLIGSVAVFAFGYRTFRKLKPLFGNVL